MSKDMAFCHLQIWRNYGKKLMDTATKAGIRVHKELQAFIFQTFPENHR